MDDRNNDTNQSAPGTPVAGKPVHTDPHLRSSNRQSSQPASHLNEVLDRDKQNFVNTLSVEDIMGMATHCRSNFQQIHENITAQFNVDSTISPEQFRIMKAYVLVNCPFDNKVIAEWKAQHDQQQATGDLAEQTPELVHSDTGGIALNKSKADENS